LARRAICAMLSCFWPTSARFKEREVTKKKHSTFTLELMPFENTLRYFSTEFFPLLSRRISNSQNAVCDATADVEVIISSQPTVEWQIQNHNFHPFLSSFVSSLLLPR
jgi:hypothetical protein